MEAKDYLALKPGRMIFNSAVKKLMVLKEIKKEKLMFVDGTWFDAYNPCNKHMQIIPEGAFDGHKLYPGYWVWVESKRYDVVQGWQQITRFSTTGGLKVFSADKKYEWIFRPEGYSIGLNGSTMHYYPPKEVSWKKNPEFLAHVADVLLAVKTNTDTCPIKYKEGLDCGCGGIGWEGDSPCRESLCYKLYGDSVKRCPCYALGKTKVRKDLIKFVLEYFDVEVKDD